MEISIIYANTSANFYTIFYRDFFFVQMSAVCDIPTLSPITNSPSLSTNIVHFLITAYRVSFNTIIHDEVFSLYSIFLHEQS